MAVWLCRSAAAVSCPGCTDSVCVCPEVIECAGGVFLPRPPRSAADRLIVISCLEDARHWSLVRRLQLPLVSAELLLSGVLHQQIDLRRHALNV